MTEYSPDFIERNGTWVLSMMGAVLTCIGIIFTYFLKSRCTRVKCCGFECERQPIPTSALAGIRSV
jgi:hypothetical protein